MTAASGKPDLDAAIQRVTNKDSLYWGFRDVPKRERKRMQEVEVRLNLPNEALSDFEALEGWMVAKIKPELNAVFIRRLQPLTNAVLITLFKEAITVAFDRGGRFHSWIHAPPGELRGWEE